MAISIRVIALTLGREPIAPVALPDTVHVAPLAPDVQAMRLFFKAPQPPAAEPQSAGSAIVIHPLRPAVPARADEQPASAWMKLRRAGLGPSAAQLAREPLAYPAAPPRLEGAVKRTYLVEPEAGPPELPRVPLNQH